MRLCRARAILWAVWVLVLVAWPAQAVPVEAIADPRPRSYLVDPAGVVGLDDAAAIETAARNVRGAGIGELLVVVVPSVDGAVPRTWGTRLFNRIRVGGGRNRGVLVLVAVDDRRAEIILGDGLDDPARVAESESIMNHAVVPRFRDGDNSSAVRVAATECARRLFHDASTLPRPPTFLDTYGLALRFGGAMGGLVLLFGLGRVAMRRRARRCFGCGARMVRLDEVEDDKHLTTGELKEEVLGSVDHDVWWCRCGEVQKLRYGSIFTRYARCPECDAVTKLSTQTVIRSATEHSQGLAEIDEHCEHCAFRASTTRAIPRDMPSRGYGSSGGGGGGGTSSGSGASGSW